MIYKVTWVLVYVFYYDQHSARRLILAAPSKLERDMALAGWPHRIRLPPAPPGLPHPNYPFPTWGGCGRAPAGGQAPAGGVAWGFGAVARGMGGPPSFLVLPCACARVPSVPVARLGAVGWHGSHTVDGSPMAAAAPGPVVLGRRSVPPTVRKGHPPCEPALSPRRQPHVNRTMAHRRYLQYQWWVVDEGLVYVPL